jgi:hypothetical protein
MPKFLTAQQLFEVLRVLPEEDRKRMRVVVSDVNDERSEIDDYFLCINRIILHVKHSFNS